MKFSVAKVFLALSLLFTVNACVFEDFDEPPVAGLPDLMGNLTISELKDMHTLGNDPRPIMGEAPVLEGIVVGNDATGSIFKELYVQDETGGIVIRIDEVGLNGLYPVGTPVAIDLSGLYIGDFNNKYQITVTNGDRIPAALLRNTIFANGDPVNVEPTLLTLEQLEDDELFDRNLSTLVAFENLQFAGGDAGVPFADVAGGQDLNRTFVDCDDNTLVTRTSSFADFAGQNTPTGNGRVVGLLDVFGTTRQIKLRNLDDLMMNGDRCGTVSGSNLISLAELRAQYTGDVTTISEDTKIRGIVISDFTTGSVNSRNIFLQDAGTGIVIRFDTEHSFPLGTDLEIAVSGQELSEFNGLLQVNNLNIDNATSQGITSVPAPRQATVADIIANANAWESTLIKIDPATVSGGPTFGADGVSVTDPSGASLTIFSRFANFSDESVPNGEGAVTAILSRFNDLQLLIRDPSDVDVEGGGGGPGDETEITAGELRSLFQSGATFVPADRFIEGIVVSDVFAGNINNRNLIVQTGESGIVIRLDEPYDIPQNNRIRLSIGGETLSEFNGVLQVAGIFTEIENLGPDTAPNPREATIADVLANGEAWESTVVQIDGVSFTDATTFPNEFMTITLSDGTGELPLFIRGGDASFSGMVVPGPDVTVSLVITEFNGAIQGYIRDLDDFE